MDIYIVIIFHHKLIFFLFLLRLLSIVFQFNVFVFQLYFLCIILFASTFVSKCLAGIVGRVLTQ